jgi:hypothetical protein
MAGLSLPLPAATGRGRRYDPLGRLVQVITAKGYLRQNQYFPWFNVGEDENDTVL